MTQTEQALRSRLEAEDFHVNFLVEAGAGAGKSHTICQRILNQLDSGQAPEEIVAITFTEKATQELKEKLDSQARDRDRRNGSHLAEQAEKIHISTIHSFCQRVLRLFPLESGCGLDFQIMESGEESLLQRDFFRRWSARDPGGHIAAFERFGGQRNDLENLFSTLLGDRGAAPVCEDPATSPAFQARQAELDQLTGHLHSALHSKLSPYPTELDTLLYPEAAQAIKSAAPSPEQLCALKVALLTTLKAENPLSRYLSALGDLNGELTELVPKLNSLHRVQGYHLAMTAMVSAVKDFLTQSAGGGRCSFDDLLLRTRDLVRDHTDARAILHQRFRVFYVDEFQDTDPIQAEILFFLTHDGAGNPRDWTCCRPAPGSLFLVGDPKQAIYRFRGADLATYKKVKDLFTGNALGEVVSLLTNFRSNQEICSFVDTAFAPRKRKGSPILTAQEQEANRMNGKVTEKLDNGLYQAGYASMDAEQGKAGQPMVYRYPNFGQKDEKKCEDAEKLARFIQNAVALGFPLYDRKEKKPLPLRYRDFLILTWKKASGTRYFDALTRLGIPVSFSGERPFRQVPQVARLAAHLRYLLAPEDEGLLIRLLLTCYGLSPPSDLLPLKQAAGCPLPLLVTWPERCQPLKGQGSDPILDALADISRKLAASRALPPTVFLDQLAEEMTGLVFPGDAADAQEREDQYSYLRQFLLRVRQFPQSGSFSALANFALEASEGSVERELALEPTADRVRIMNLHKAKGLEGKVVILAMDPAPRIHVDQAHRETGGGQEGYYAIKHRNGSGSTSELFVPEDWAALSAPERCHFEAEKVRLGYVAATRAEQLLLIASGSDDHAKTSGTYSGWAKLAANASTLPTDRSHPLYTLLAPLGENALVSAAPSAQAAAPTATQFSDLSGQLTQKVTEKSGVTLRHISPSALDKSHRLPVDPDDPATLQAALPHDDTSEQTAPTVSAAPLAPARSSPMGADWGTIVHRLMEFYVLRRPIAPETAIALARQAVRETVPSSCLSKQQEALLFQGAVPTPYSSMVDTLAKAALNATRFWFDESCPLRQYIGDSLCYPEFPFHLRLTPGDQALYDFVRQRLPEATDFQGDLSVTGILDLAALRDEQWHIVDYKTDHIRHGETEEAYRKRLTGEYHAQLNAYAKVLSKLTGKTVASAQLCAIPLGGALVDIPLES